MKSKKSKLKSMPRAKSRGQKYNMKTYLNELASNEPTPGGGSASALAGALGAALIEKVCNFTIGKEKFRPVEADMRKILKDAAIARKRLLQLVELDRKGFIPVAKAYKLPKNTEEQKIVRKQKIDEAMTKTSVVPQEIKKICDELLPYCDRLEKDANKILIDDTRCARELLKGASSGAKSFVWQNYWTGNP